MLSSSCSWVDDGGGGEEGGVSIFMIVASLLLLLILFFVTIVVEVSIYYFGLEPFCYIYLSTMIITLKNNIRGLFIALNQFIKPMRSSMLCRHNYLLW
mmetsp:Transcript_1926/g.2853  ORF Transcript_1926/g.2853 Transcript_1926/m.2853 type:complete len:98 (+) Transcript_1926:166-459(+)